MPFYKNIVTVNHLSKHLIVSSNKAKISESDSIFYLLPNIVQIYRENNKTIAKYFDISKNFTTFLTLDNIQKENFTEILFPDKVKSLDGVELYAAYMDDQNAVYIGEESPICMWYFYVEIVAEKLNTTVKYIKLRENDTDSKSYQADRANQMVELIANNKLDFYLNYHKAKYDLESYYYENYCYMAPLPQPYSITELILFLPLDTSCWKYLGITLVASTVVWRLSENHWSFPFGAFSYFMGQAQLVVRIKTYVKINLASFFCGFELF